MCIKAVEEDPWSLEHLPALKHKRCVISQCGNNLFLDVCSRLVCDTATASKLWHDDDDDEVIEWSMVIKIAMSRKQKGLMRIAWHPSRW